MPTTTSIIVLFIICFTILLVSLSTFIIWVIYKYQQKQNSYYTHIDILKTTYENSLLKTRIEIQEQTFQNISREIHDNVGQKLSLAKLYLNTINDTSLETENTSIIIGDALEDLRNLSRTLSADLVASNGLVHALQSEIKYLINTKIFKVDICLKGENIFLNEKTDLILFRIIQEALQNIMKHSKCNEVYIELNYLPYEFKLIVRDNGIGYIRGSILGQGLRNMETRTKMLGGIFNITGEEKKGTIINITIPINEK